jgi:hypothetical protein
MEMQQMMEHLLAKIDTSQAKTKATQERTERQIGSLLSDRDELKGEIRADREQMLAKMNTNQAGMIATQEDIKSGQVEIRSIVRAFQEKMDTCIASRRDDQKETMSCQEITEVNTEKTESDRGMMQSIAEHQVAPMEDAVVKTVNTQKKRNRGRKTAAGQRGKPKELTQSDCGSRKKLAAACKKVSSCATVAWCKRNLFKKIGTQGNCGPQSKLTAAGIKMTHHARVAWRRENFIRKDWTRNQT